MYQLHKSCFFKLGCTFIFVLIQILCDKNFKLKKNVENESSIESNNELTLDDIDHKPKIKIERDTIIEEKQKKSQSLVINLVAPTTIKVTKKL